MMQPEAPRTPINSWAEVPSSFASEDDEREWWATHDLTDRFYDQNREETEIADLKFQHVKLLQALERVEKENRSLRQRVEQIEAKLASIST
jgi:uncharacterized protein (DUF3084 family)